MEIPKLLNGILEKISLNKNYYLQIKGLVINWIMRHFKK